MKRAVVAALFFLLGHGFGLAQERIYRLGILGPGDSTSWSLGPPVRRITLAQLEKLGFVESHNLVLEVRYGPTETLPNLAREIVAAKPDAIIAVSAAAIRAARQATSTIPIVMSFIGEDPVAAGLAVSLARPGGNVTGLVMLAAELDAKRLHLLHEAMPAARRIAVLAIERVLHEAPKLANMRQVAQSEGLELLIHPVAIPEDYPAAFAAMRASGAEALVVMSAPELFRDVDRLAALAIEAKLPTVCEWREMAQRGCLLGYGPSLVELRRRTADFVARIFRGADPAELPIEAPTLFEFAVNLKTAQRIGIELPPSLLLRADEVIE